MTGIISKTLDLPFLLPDVIFYLQLFPKSGGFPSSQKNLAKAYSTTLSEPADNYISQLSKNHRIIKIEKNL